MRFQPVARDERQKLAQRGPDVQKSREQRRTVEAQVVDTAARKPNGRVEPTKVKLPKSPIVAKPAGQFAKSQAPPRAQQTPKPDPKIQPKAESSGRPPSAEVSHAQPEPSKAVLEKKPALASPP
jgi:hypothetical protein